MPPTNLVRVQEKGQVTLSPTARRRLEIKKGDIVAVRETADDFLIIPQAVMAANDIEDMRRILKKEGFSLDELIESARELRGDLMRERYGIDSGEQETS